MSMTDWNWRRDAYPTSLALLYIGEVYVLSKTLCSGNCPPIKRENFFEIARNPFKTVQSCKMQGTVQNGWSVLDFSKFLSVKSRQAFARLGGTHSASFFRSFPKMSG
jgi:hypothetical protein